MTYMVDDKTRAHTFFIEKPRSVFEKITGLLRGMPYTENSGKYTDVDVKVLNGREQIFEMSKNSFTFGKWETKLSHDDFCKLDEDETIKSKYYDEMKKYATEVLGASYVDVIHHQLRNSKIASENDNAAHGKFASYATAGIHTDSSPSGSDDVYTYVYKNKPEVEALIGNKRYLYFNIWRSIDEQNPIKNNHLAVCDETSLSSPEDYMFRDLWMRAPKSSPIPWYKIPQYTLNVRNYLRHKWYYFPDMVKDEVICFKQADSDFRNSGRMTFHCSVEDPSVDVDAPVRQSIEARLFCVFDGQDIETVPDKCPHVSYENSTFPKQEKSKHA